MLGKISKNRNSLGHPWLIMNSTIIFDLDKFGNVDKDVYIFRKEKNNRHIMSIVVKTWELYHKVQKSKKVMKGKELLLFLVANLW